MKKNTGQECLVGYGRLDLREAQSLSEPRRMSMEEAFIKNADPWLLPTDSNSRGGWGGMLESTSSQASQVILENHLSLRTTTQDHG